jgi:hypothetical protein
MRISLRFLLFVLMPYIAICAWIGGCDMPGADRSDRVATILIITALLLHALSLKFTYRKSCEARRERLCPPQDS